MKLLADAMLGRLARWLRILGYDTAYTADTDDFAVMRLARAEDRLLLTRDHDLAARRGVRALLIESEELEEQLHQVWTVVGLPPDPSLSRCPVCNESLIDAEPALVAARVPPYVRKTHQHFSLCAKCNHIYWEGTHWHQIQTVIAQLRDQAGFDTMGEETRYSEQRRSTTGTN